MTLSETLDEIAKSLGWSKLTYRGGLIAWRRNEVETGDHPVPATVDAIEALWPSGWRLQLAQHGSPKRWRAVAWSDDGLTTVARNGATMLEALAALLLDAISRDANRSESPNSSASNPVKPDSSEGA